MLIRTDDGLIDACDIARASLSCDAGVTSIEFFEHCSECGNGLTLLGKRTFGRREDAVALLDKIADGSAALCAQEREAELMARAEVGEGRAN